MYKRLSAIVLILIIILSLTACGGNYSTNPSGNKTVEPIQETCEMPISDLKMESDVDQDSKKDANNSDTIEETTTVDYQGTYHSTDSTGKNYTIVVEENTLTVNDRYVADFTIDDVIRTYWRGTITDTKTGEKEEEQDFQLQTLHEDGKDQMFLTLYAWFNEEVLIVEYAKRE